MIKQKIFFNSVKKELFAYLDFYQNFFLIIGILNLVTKVKIKKYVFSITILILNKKEVCFKRQFHQIKEAAICVK